MHSLRTFSVAAATTSATVVFEPNGAPYGGGQVVLMMMMVVSTRIGNASNAYRKLLQMTYVRAVNNT